jgi:GT2 family glycosyltransferase
MQVENAAPRIETAKLALSGLDGDDGSGPGTAGRHSSSASVVGRLGSVVEENGGAPWEVVRKQHRQIEHLQKLLDQVSGERGELQRLVLGMREEILRREDDLQADIYELEAAQTLRELAGTETSKQVAYQHLIGRIRQVVRSVCPHGATILVASKGDPKLLNLYGRRGRHFPQDEKGVYAGFYPHNGVAAVAHLEALRAQGADYFLLPSTGLWWLEKYPEFRRHLEDRYDVVFRDADTCVAFWLREVVGPRPSSLGDSLIGVIAAFRERFGRDPAVLDWDTGHALAKSHPDANVFSPVARGNTLPYLDGTIDVVAVAAADDARSAEARRVASAVVVSWDENGTLEASWLQEPNGLALPSVSIVIPVHDGWEYTDACLRTLRETLPNELRAEIIVVDDASTDHTSERVTQLRRRDARLRLVRNRRNQGFIASCNRGARAATGDILLFLNNDTVLLPGWLPPLLRVFREHPEAGAVGAKLLFPQGLLQEAGGLIFRDGSAAHFGRGDAEIDGELYSFLREVDYCSGALLATPRALFSEVGGFDKRYRPAYYEDVDYCFRVRALGRRVYCQPESVVVHREGATSGTDLSQGVKRYQAINHAKFRDRWAAELVLQPVRPREFTRATWRSLAVRRTAEGGVRP